MFINKNMHFRT